MAATNLYREVVNSISAHVAIIDEKGVILETNQAWEQFADDNDMQATYQSVGSSYLNICEVAADDEDDAACSLGSSTGASAGARAASSLAERSP